MTAIIDGSGFTATVDAAARYIEGTLMISGNSELEQIQLSVWNPERQTGTFRIDIEDNPHTGIYVFSKNVTDNYYSYLGDGEGIVVISNITEATVKGTFSFEAENLNGDKVKITDGTFNLEIIETSMNF